MPYYVVVLYANELGSAPLVNIVLQAFDHKFWEIFHIGMLFYLSREAHGSLIHMALPTVKWEDVNVIFTGNFWPVCCECDVQCTCTFVKQLISFLRSAFSDYNTDQFTPAKVENDTVSSPHIYFVLWWLLNSNVRQWCCHRHINCQCASYYPNMLFIQNEVA